MLYYLHYAALSSVLCLLTFFRIAGELHLVKSRGLCYRGPHHLRSKICSANLEWILSMAYCLCGNSYNYQIFNDSWKNCGKHDVLSMLELKKISKSKNHTVYTFLPHTFFQYVYCVYICFVIVILFDNYPVHK